MHAPNRNRLSVIVTRDGRHSWSGDGVLMTRSLEGLEGTLAAHDVERIVIDGCASADQFLDFLASTAAVVAGDVMLLREDGGAFLSSVGRGGDRVLYALSRADVAFYVQTNGLMVGRSALAWTA